MTDALVAAGGLDQAGLLKDLRKQVELLEDDLRARAGEAQALANLINDRTTDAGWDTARLTPLLAGLAELMTWIHQWHTGYDPDWGGDPAEEYQSYLDDQRTRHHLTRDDLPAWRPAPNRRKGGVAKTGNPM